MYTQLLPVTAVAALLIGSTAIVHAQSRGGVGAGGMGGAPGASGVSPGYEMQSEGAPGASGFAPGHRGDTAGRGDRGDRVGDRDRGDAPRRPGDRGDDRTTPVVGPAREDRLRNHPAGRTRGQRRGGAGTDTHHHQP